MLRNSKMLLTMRKSMRLFRQIPSKTVGVGLCNTRHVASVSASVPAEGKRPKAFVSSNWYFEPSRLLSSQAERQAMNAATTEDVKAPVPSNARLKERDLNNSIQNLNNEVQTSWRVVTFRVKKALRLLEQVDKCSPSMALILLRCFGHAMVDEPKVRRSEMVLGLWKKLEEMDVEFDVSHYNALFKIHIENEHPVSPTQFLTWMEEKGIKPNRVTYQHMIAKFCQTGDVSGAAAVSEQMKNEDIPINEYVFLSLITGHCRNKDFESAREVIKIMEESGLDGGIEAELRYILGLIKSEKSFDEVKEALEKIAKKEMILDDHDYFQIILELVKIGKMTEAWEIYDKLPKNRGFLGEVRSIVPQLVFAGGVDIAFDLTIRLNEEARNEENYNNGVFFLRALVKIEYELEKYMEILRKMKEKVNDECMIRVLEACVLERKLEYGSKLRQKILDEFGKIVFDNPVASHSFAKINLSQLETIQELREFVNAAETVGLNLATPAISDYVLPKILDLEFSVSHSLRNFVSDTNIQFSRIANQTCQYLLNKETDEAIKTVANLLIYSSFHPVPIIWNASLARCFLATHDLQSLITIVFASRYTRQNLSSHFKNLNQVNSTRFLEYVHTMAPKYEKSKSADKVLEEVLLELKKVHLGVPEEVSQVLLCLVTDQEVKQLIDEMKNMDQEESWSKEKIESFSEERKKLSRLPKKRPQNFVPILGDSFVRRENLPNDVTELERLAKVIEKRSGRVNFMISNELIHMYLMDGKIDAAVSYIVKGLNAQGAFSYEPRFDHIETIILQFLEENEVEKAEKFLKSVQEGNCKLFLTTYIYLCLHYVRGGHRDKMLSTLDNLNKEIFVTHNLQIFPKRMHENLEDAMEIANIMKDKDLISEATFSNLSYFSHLHTNKLDLAVKELEKIAEEHKKLPYKFKLMEKLIEAEDMEKMQQVLDISTQVIGEENSLYDLVHNFLSLGKLTQARKLLETPGLRYNGNKIKYIGNQLIKEGNLSGLENLAIYTRNLFGCNRDTLYELLVNAHQNNPDKVIEIWLMMQEENHSPSDRLRIQMASFLKSGGKEVPFHVPQGKKYQENAESAENKLENNK